MKMKRKPDQAASAPADHPFSITPRNPGCSAFWPTVDTLCPNGAASNIVPLSDRRMTCQEQPALTSRSVKLTVSGSLGILGS